VRRRTCCRGAFIRAQNRKYCVVGLISQREHAPKISDGEFGAKIQNDVGCKRKIADIAKSSELDAILNVFKLDSREVSGLRQNKRAASQVEKVLAIEGAPVPFP